MKGRGARIGASPQGPVLEFKEALETGAMVRQQRGSFLYLGRSVGKSGARGPTLRVVLDTLRFTLRVGSRVVSRSGGEGLTLYRLPAYCPHLNLIEGVWRKLKGFLMPRRFYDCVAELKQAVLHGLRLLEAVEIQYSLGDT